MLTCKEVATALASDELERSEWRRRLAVRMHLVMCRHCRRYAAQLRALDAAARALVTGRSADREHLDRLEGAILAALPGPGGESGPDDS